MPEVYALEGKTMRPLTAHNRALNAGIAWSPVRDFAATASDGSEVHGILTLPAGYVPGQRYPTVLWIHGGPTAQDAHDRYDAAMDRRAGLCRARGQLSRQFGPGRCLWAAIAADWGNKEVLDLMPPSIGRWRRALPIPRALALAGGAMAAFSPII
jgi:hypothetical protein